jgi:AsmA-like C-terminal region
VEKEKKIKSPSFLRKLFKVLSYFFIVWILILIVIAALFYIFKDDISKKLLLSLNDIQNGEISLEDISFSPFSQFPSISIGINDVIYFENKKEDRDSLEKPIVTLDVIYVAFDVIDLIGGRINVSKITIDGGTLNFVTYKDSTVNLFKALGTEEPANLSENKEQIPTDTFSTYKSKSSEEVKNTPEEITDIDLAIEQLTIKNLTINFENQIFHRAASYSFKNLSSSFHHQTDLIKGSLNAEIQINSIQLADKELLKNKELNIETNFSFDREKLLINVQQSYLSFGNAKFTFNGFYDIKNDENVDFEINGSDQDLSFFELLFSDEGIKNINKGDFYFNGTIKGKSKVNIPKIKFTFGLTDTEIFNPVTNKTISNLNLIGKFNSGTKNDLSQGELIIDTLYADSPDGALKLSGFVRNFQQPEIDFNLYLKANITGWDKLFKLDIIKNLKGNIEVTDKFKGKYVSGEKRIVSELNISKISLENVSLVIPGALILDNVNGLISRENDKIYFDSLNVISEDTDLLINGEVENLQYLFLNIEKEINASLNIKSSIFDLPNFLSFDPSIKRDFPHRIIDLDLTVNASTSTSKALKFKSFPEIDFDIKKLEATAEGFLPPLTINNGRFKVSESILGFHMDFDHFLTDIAGGQIDLTGDYNSSKFQPFYIKTELQFDDVNPAKFFYDEQKDSIPETINGSLNGSLFAELQFATDTMEIKLINIKKGNLRYYFAEDTIETKMLGVFAQDVYWNSNKNSNPLATLTTNLIIKIDDLYTDYFKLDHIYYDINIEDGTYTVIPQKKSLFGSKGSGRHILKPFDEIPSYRFQYSIKNFNTADLLQTFLEDTVLTGKMNLSMDIKMTGNEWDSLVSKLNGDIHLTGKDLIMYGVDTDELLDKFKRSQRFTLVDVGAVLLAGPIGIAVTKGTDYASMIVLNSGEETNITTLVSDWSIHNGRLIVEDVAFATKKNRIAAKGWIDFSSDSLNLTFALLNKKGCSIFSQDLYGSFDNLEAGDIKVVGTILAPVTNLIDDIFGSDCEVFYNGAVKHPN